MNAVGAGGVGVPPEGSAWCFNPQKVVTETLPGAPIFARCSSPKFDPDLLDEYTVEVRARRPPIARSV